jgi:cysteine desulfurase
MNIDLMSLSGHKIYGPNGIGACYVRRRPRVRLDPIISGGGQERGLRSGTLAPHLVVGFGEACRIAKEEMPVSGTSEMLNCHVNAMLKSSAVRHEANSRSFEETSRRPSEHGAYLAKR